MRVFVRARSVILNSKPACIPETRDAELWLQVKIFLTVEAQGDERLVRRVAPCPAAQTLSLGVCAAPPA
jgi:hypothetical protein